jgi:nucleoside-diphosphate-sugar epimerase
MASTLLPELPVADLDHMFDGLGEKDWRFFYKKRLFVTGGSGFIGKWLLSALLTANQRLSLQCRVEILTRSPSRFRDSTPQIACAEGVVLREGDVRSFIFPDGKYDVIVHGATDVESHPSPLDTLSTCIDGTQRVLQFARYSGAQDFLLTSSGAVYGKHPSIPSGLPETHLGGPDQLLPSSAYGEGKRISECLACAVAAETKLRVKIARIYAQVGPYLPLDKHFAIGNFINDALANREIVIRGDGTPFRSYLYAADTAVWLWAMVIRGKPSRAWNVGGAEGLSIADLANRVGRLLGATKGSKILTPKNPKKSIECYVPDVSRALVDLQLPAPLPLDHSILRTANWIKNTQNFSSKGMK